MLNKNIISLFSEDKLHLMLWTDIVQLRKKNMQ